MSKGKPGFEKHLREKTRNGFNYEHLSRIVRNEARAFPKPWKSPCWDARRWLKVGSPLEVRRQLEIGIRRLQFCSLLNPRGRIEVALASLPLCVRIIAA